MKKIAVLLVLCLVSFSSVSEERLTIDVINKMSLYKYKSDVYEKASKCFYLINLYKEEGAKESDMNFSFLSPNKKELMEADFYLLYVSHIELLLKESVKMFELLAETKADRQNIKNKLATGEFRQKLLTFVTLDEEKVIEKGVKENPGKTRKWAAAVSSEKVCGAAIGDLRALNALTGHNTLPFKG